MKYLREHRARNRFSKLRGKVLLVTGVWPLVARVCWIETFNLTYNNIETEPVLYPNTYAFNKNYINPQNIL